MTDVPSPKLVTCTACGGIVSRRAPRCPHCGEEWPGRQAEARGAVRHGLANWQIALVVATVVAVVGGAMYFGRGGRSFIQQGVLAELLEDAESLGDFALGEDWDDFEQRGHPYGIARASRGEGRESGLGWVCLDDGLNVVLYLGGYFGGDDDHDIEVRYRFDGGAASETEYWRLFSDNESAFLALAGVPGFTASALDADSVTIRATDPYDGERLTVTFGLAGLDSLLQRLSTCGPTRDSSVVELLQVDSY